MGEETYKILLADDEGIVTDSLQFILKKHFGNLCQCAVAKNGRQAIELAESFRPDIAFLDIRMPGISGLKAMEEIRSQNQSVKIVILTAYDNVDYTKEALRLGAADYLTKPIHKGVIVERMTALMRTIDVERQKRKEALLVKEKMEAMVPIIENGFIISLIIQRGDEETTAHYRELLGLNEDYGIIMVLEWQGEGGSTSGGGIHLYHHYDKIAELVKIYFKAFVSGIMGNKIICAIPTTQPQLEYEERRKFTKSARNLANSLKHVVGVDFKVGVGSPDHWSGAFNSYQEALNALRHGKHSITHIDDLIVQDTRKKQRQLMEQEVLKAVVRGLEHEVRREATLFASWELKNQSEDLEHQRIQLVSLLLLSQRAVQAQGSEPKSIHQGVADLLSIQTAGGLQLCFVDAMVELTQSVLIPKEKPDGIIAKAQDYIQQNFRKDLALEDVAKTAGVSPYYFSKLFKEEAGINFMEYLTAIRIDTAKRLLADGQMSIKQVCLESGYANPNYFSRIFKKWVGITPTEFRDGLQQNP